MNLINQAFAEDIAPVTTSTEIVQTETTPAQNNLYSFLPIIVIFVVFYFFMIRPQVKQQKQHKNMLSQLKKGDKILTNAGILGVVVKVEENEYIQIEIAQNTKVRMLKSAVIQLANNITATAIDEKKDKKDENKVENLQEISGDVEK